MAVVQEPEIGVNDWGDNIPVFTFRQNPPMPAPIHPADGFPEYVAYVEEDTSLLVAMSKIARASISAIDKEMGESAMDTRTLWGIQRQALEKVVIK